LRFEGAGPGRDLAAWCLEQALRNGVSLPAQVRGRQDLADFLEPGFVSPGALARLEDLGLGTSVEDAVLAMILRGEVRLPDRVSPLVGALREVREPTSPAGFEGLADLAGSVYAVHDRLGRVAGSGWLARLDALASTPLDLPSLVDVLRDARGAQLWLIDALGLPLLGAFLEQADTLLRGWRIRQLQAALVPAPTTTEAFCRSLVEAGVPRFFEKTDVVDDLLHDRFRPFPDLARMAMAALHPQARRVLARLDPTRPLVVFADHGFRLSQDGRRWEHGGASTLEQAVPVVWAEAG
jgi:hypothetical protein